MAFVQTLGGSWCNLDLIFTIMVRECEPKTDPVEYSIAAYYDVKAKPLVLASYPTAQECRERLTKLMALAVGNVNVTSEMWLSAVPAEPASRERKLARREKQG